MIQNVTVAFVLSFLLLSIYINNINKTPDSVLNAIENAKPRKED